MSLKFTPEMFESQDWIQPMFGGSKAIECVDAAKQAQNIFDKWLNQQTFVWAVTPHSEAWTDTKFAQDKYSARLVDIRALKKECEHKSRNYQHGITYDQFTCLDCKKTLKATWSEA